MDLKPFLRVLVRFAVPVFISWALIGVLLGSGAVLTALALVMATSFGTAIVSQGYYSIRSLLRRKKYVGALIDFIFHGFGLTIALVVLYMMILHGILRK